METAWFTFIVVNMAEISMSKKPLRVLRMDATTICQVICNIFTWKFVCRNIYNKISTTTAFGMNTRTICQIIGDISTIIYVCRNIYNKIWQVRHGKFLASETLRHIGFFIWTFILCLHIFCCIFLYMNIKEHRPWTSSGIIYFTQHNVSRNVSFRES